MLGPGGILVLLFRRAVSGMNHRKDYPNTGSGRTIVSSAQRRDERTIALTDKVGGKVVDTQEISISAERNTLTMTIHVPDRSDPNVFVFERQ